MQNVLVLGGSYGGARAAQLLSQSIGREYRVILIDRNSHANHLYVIPRFGILPGHEHKAFIPYSNIYRPTNSTSVPAPIHDSRHLVLHARVTRLAPHHVTLDRTFPELGFHSNDIPFKYAVYALGSHLPTPIDLWSAEENILASVPEVSSKPEVGLITEKIEYGGTKREAIDWLKRCQERIKNAGSILVVGGGALGIQFATDIASFYPEKKVTLLHSRQRLLPRFSGEMHTEIMKAMEDHRIDVILGERLDLSSTSPGSVKSNKLGQRVVRTLKGREIAADLLLLCTGQVPNTSLISALSPSSVDSVSKLAYVLPTLQLAAGPVTSMTRGPTSGLESALRRVRIRTSSSSLTSTNASVSTSEELTDTESESYDALEQQQDTEVETETALDQTPFPHIFVIGDAADAFGAIKAGHNAYFQGEVAAKNVLALIKNEEQLGTTEIENETEKPSEIQKVVLDRYTPGPPAIKVSLGIGSSAVYEINGVVGTKDDVEDLDSAAIWRYFGIDDAEEKDMFA